MNGGSAAGFRSVVNAIGEEIGKFGDQSLAYFVFIRLALEHLQTEKTLRQCFRPKSVMQTQPRSFLAPAASQFVA